MGEVYWPGPTSGCRRSFVTIVRPSTMPPNEPSSPSAIPKGPGSRCRTLECRPRALTVRNMGTHTSAGESQEAPGRYGGPPRPSRPARRRLTILAWLSLVPLGWLSWVMARAHANRGAHRRRLCCPLARRRLRHRRLAALPTSRLYGSPRPQRCPCLPLPRVPVRRARSRRARPREDGPLASSRHTCRAGGSRC
jgi:hypothetical protein